MRGLFLFFQCFIVIYSEAAIFEKDTRTEYFEASPFWKEKLDANVAMIPKDEIVKIGNRYLIKETSESYAKYYGVCSDERFVKQPVPAYCSAFLISKNRVATAGHCVETFSDCEKFYFVFGFQSNRKDSVETTFPANQVFECKKVVGTSKDPDVAVIELDREVTQVTPLVLATKEPKEDAKVALTGFPHGLPLKLHTGGMVQKNNDYASEDYFEAFITNFKGNSGSPVINESTGMVEGVLTVGFGEWDDSVDPLTKEKCSRPAIRTKQDSTAAWVTRAKFVRSFLERK